MNIVLDNAQTECVNSNINQHLHIIAGPGSGKTATIIKRVCFLLQQGVAPKLIILTTFTNKAATEIKHRLAELVGSTLARQVCCNTFHSIGYKLLRDWYADNVPNHTPFTIIDDGEKNSFFMELLDSNKTRKLNRFQLARYILKVYNEYRGSYPRYIITDSVPYLTYEQVKYMCLQLDAHKQEFGLLDFNDILIWWCDNVHKLPKCNVFIVDEMQDCNNLQHCIIMKYYSQGAQITAVGDDAQSIYGWRGSKVEYIRTFPNYIEPVVSRTLVNNYRSSPAIVALSNKLLKHNRVCIQKQLVSMLPLNQTFGNTKPQLYVFNAGFPEEEQDLCTTIVNLIQTELNASRSCIMLSRCNNGVKKFQPTLTKNNIPYQQLNKDSLLRKQFVNVFVTALHAVFVPSLTDFAYEKILKLIPKIGPVRARGIINAVRTEMSVYAACYVSDSDETPIKLSWLKRFCAYKPDKSDVARSIAGLQQVYVECLEIIGGPGYDFSVCAQKCGRLLLNYLFPLILQHFNALTIDKEVMHEQLEAVVSVMQFFTCFEEFLNSIHLDTINQMSTEVLNEQEEELLKNNAEINTTETNYCQLGTIHSAKGLEFDTVLLYMEDRNVSQMCENEEEMRLLFVACSRARTRLVLLCSVQYIENINTLVQVCGKCIEPKNINAQYITMQ